MCCLDGMRSVFLHAFHVIESTEMSEPSHLTSACCPHVCRQAGQDDLGAGQSFELQFIKGKRSDLISLCTLKTMRWMS